MPLPPRSGRVSGLLIVSLLANLGVLGWLGYAGLSGRLPGSPEVAGGADRPMAPATADADGIGALGRVQPAGGILGLFGPPGDRLTELFAKAALRGLTPEQLFDSLTVAVGDAVKPGQVLGTLAGDATRREAVDVFAGQIAEADTLRASLVASKEAKLEDADYEYSAVDAKLEADLAGLDAKAAILGVQERRAVAERDRLRRSKADGLPVAEQDVLTADTAVAQVAEERKAAVAQRGLLVNQRTKSESSLKAKKKLIAAEVDRAVAQVPTNSLLASKRAAERRADDGRLVAPREGRVVKVLARPGDTLGNSPVVQVADARELVVLAEVYETDVARLRTWLGTAGRVTAEIDGRVLGDKVPPLKGSVTTAGVAPMIARNQVYALGPREDADRRVVEVEVKLDPAAAAKLADFLGLQVRVKLLAPGR